MRLKSLELRDKAVFEKYLGSEKHELSVYSFDNIFIWKTLFDIRWSIDKDNLFVFFSDKIGSFLYLEPLAKDLSPEALEEAFDYLGSLNRNREISRIENAEEKNLDLYSRLGFEYKEKSCDYVCVRDSLAGLKGNVFKSKRADYNYFLKNYKFVFSDFSVKQKTECLKLYDRWAAQRRKTNNDDIYRFMLEDSRKSLLVLLQNYDDLNCAGKIVKADGEIKGFTFGFKLNKDTFCILYEITDLTIKGLAQFIFREFCASLKEYKYINIMDDSGLENLKCVKLSYHPVKLVPAFIVKRGV